MIMMILDSGSNEDRLKAMTMGGSVSSKAGTMTGGVTKDDTNCAGRFSDQKLKELRTKKDALDAELIVIK